VHTVSISDTGVRADALPKDELAYMTDLSGSIKAAAARMRAAGRSLGISKTAKRLLRRL
jgi:hypothetical protein